MMIAKVQLLNVLLRAREVGSLAEITLAYKWTSLSLALDHDYFYGQDKQATD